MLRHRLGRKDEGKRGIEGNRNKACGTFSLFGGWKIHLESSELEGKQFRHKGQPSHILFHTQHECKAWV